MEEKVAQKTAIAIEDLTKQEIINKYKSLLLIAKKAKQAKDELAEENRTLKETLSRSETQKDADKKALLTMKEMLEQFTQNKLQLTTQLSELQQRRREDNEQMTQLQIENESSKRQMNRLTEENDALLIDIDRMEQQLQQVNVLGLEQMKNLELLEVDVVNLKAAEALNATLQAELVHAETKYKTTSAELDDLQSKYQNVKEVNSQQCKKFNALKERFIDVHRKLKKLKECKSVLLETQHEYAESVSKWQQEIIEASKLVCDKMNALQMENEELQHKLFEQNKGSTLITNAAEAMELKIDATDIIQKLLELQHLSNCAFADQKEKQLDNQRLTQELCDLKENMKVNEEKMKTTNNIKQTAIESHEVETLKLQLSEKDTLLNALQLELEKLQTQDAQRNVAVTQETDVIETELKNQAERINTLEMEKLKIINEMGNLLCEKTATSVAEKNALHETEMLRREADECKARIEEFLSANENSKIQILQLQQTCDDLQARYELKEREHTDLLGEMRELNEALKARGDVISRQQEKQQELLAELRKTTTKLKESETINNEKQQAFNAVQQNLTVAQSKVSGLESECAKLNEELQSTRTQDSNIDAQSDILSTSTISRAEEQNRLRELDDSYEEKYNKLRGLAAKLKKKLQEQTAYCNEMEQQLTGTNALKKDSEELKINVMQLQQEVTTLKGENQKLKSTRKQANVLNLEIEAAEKSLNDVTAKLTTKCAEIEALRETLTSKENTVEQLRKEINILASDKDSEIAHAKQLKQQIDRMQTQVKDAVHGQQQAFLQSKELEQTLERCKLDLEQVQLQLANSESKHQVAFAQSNQAIETLATKLQTAESTIETLNVKLTSSERASEDLRIEYLDYKVKAQAVLRKNQSKETTRERELEEELKTLRETDKELQATTQVQMQRIEQGDKQIEQLQQIEQSVQRRNGELLNLIEELRQQNENLALDNQRQQQQQQTALRSHRQQIDNMDQCHKMQVQELEQQLKRTQTELSKINTNQLPTIDATYTTHPPNQSNVLNTSIEQNKNDILLMEREAAEGSEEAAETLAQLAANRKISTASRRSHHDFMPLDELLNTPLNAISDRVTTINAISSLRRQNSSVSGAAAVDDDDYEERNAQLALQATKERLQIQETRVRHLTTLLAENEQDLAKLTQMNDMLKEELRRQERAVEREQHMHNSEYLKNVFLKFLTLSNADERLRLVPVLNTILRLSRSECDMLNCVAKGQKITSDTNQRSWGSFLTSWGGSGSGGGGGGSNVGSNNQ